jgi:hypothetical protein
LIRVKLSAILSEEEKSKFQFVEPPVIKPILISLKEPVTRYKLEATVVTEPKLVKQKRQSKALPQIEPAVNNKKPVELKYLFKVDRHS